ncbi:MAG: arsenate reductase (glutaredoxin) [Cellvibrionaceae bacterium]|nr:arsenate reductase (glutaredoxin) [Cellvibrionaceae bacterium]
MVTIYHNPRCSKSRQTLALLEERAIQTDIVLYLEHPPSVAQLQDLLNKLSLGARDIVRTTEDDYKRLNLKDSQLSDDALLAAIAEHPKLLQRPIVVNQQKAAIGRPPENVLAIL